MSMRMCIRCKTNPADVAGRLRHLCPECKRKSRSTRINGNRLRKLAHKGTSCEHCGFIALHPCQLDVDHIDGNRDNDDPSNYRTLCANCHRLKTQTERDSSWTDKEPIVSPQLRLIK